MIQHALCVKNWQGCAQHRQSPFTSCDIKGLCEMVITELSASFEVNTKSRPSRTFRGVTKWHLVEDISSNCAYTSMHSI